MVYICFGIISKKVELGITIHF